MRRWWLRGSGSLVTLVVLTVLGLLLGASGPPRPSQAAGVDQATPAGTAGASADQLRELATRLLTPPYGGPTGQAETVSLLPGQLPNDPAFDLSVPPGGRVVGSAVYAAGGTTAAVDIVVDAPGNASDVETFYQRVLTGRGWSDSAYKGMPLGGFQPNQGPITRFFCAPAGPGFLQLSVLARTGSPNDVRLHAELTTPGPCGINAGIPTGPPGYDKLPPLYAPNGVQLQSAGPGGGGPLPRASSSAEATTELSVSDLEAHFAQQLQAAGWTRLDGGAQGSLAWSTWQVPGPGGWQGFLYVVQGPGQHRRDLYVQVESSSPQAGGPPGAPPVPPPATAVP